MEDYLHSRVSISWCNKLLQMQNVINLHMLRTINLYGTINRTIHKAISSWNDIAEHCVSRIYEQCRPGTHFTKNSELKMHKLIIVENELSRKWVHEISVSQRCS